jgi:hypothetical protein
VLSRNDDQRHQRAGDELPDSSGLPAPYATASGRPCSLPIRCRSAPFTRNTSRRPPRAPWGFASTNSSRACLHASNASHTSVPGHSDASNRNNRSSTPGPLGARRRFTTHAPRTARGVARAMRIVPPDWGASPLLRANPSRRPAARVALSLPGRVRRHR